MLKKRGVLWLVVAGLIVAAEGPAGERSVGGIVSERLLSRAGFSPLEDDSFRVSPDCRRVAYAAKAGDRWIVVSDGIEGEKFDGVEKESIAFSPDSLHLAYAAHAGGKWFVVLDGKKSELKGSVPEEFEIVFSPDSQRIAYVVDAGGNRSVAVDGKGGKPYGRILGPPVFSPDSKRVAYGAVVDKDMQVVVVDGEEGEKNDCGRACAGVSIVFSPDSRRVAHSAPELEKRMVVVDGRKSDRYDGVGRPVFAPDSLRVAHAAALDGKVFMVVDGKKERPYDEVSHGTFFSPDGAHMAYMAKADGRWFAVLDGQEGAKYEDYWQNTLRFSPDGRVAGYIAASGGKWVAVIGGKEGRKYDLGPPVFDARNPENVIGWKNERESGTLVFGPDGRRVAYLAQSGRIVQQTFRKSGELVRLTFSRSDWFAVVDGKEGKKYDDIPAGSIVFSPGGGHVAYSARKNGKGFVVVDGKEGKRYDRVIVEEVTVRKSSRLEHKERRGRIVFDSPDRMRYLAVKDGGIYSVTLRLTGRSI